jgi:hypothetical protein
VHEGSPSEFEKLDGYVVLIVLKIFIIDKDGNVDSIRHGTNQKINMGYLNSLFPAFIAEFRGRFIIGPRRQVCFHDAF